MSIHMSPAQALPVDVLHSILNWAVDEQRSALSGDTYNVTRLRELLTVSSTWRQVALEFLWRKLDIIIKTNEVYLYRPGWVTENTLPHNAVNLVRKVHVYVPMADVISGAANKLLVNYMGNTRCLPLAKKLHVIMSDYSRQKCDPIDMEVAMANALEFAKLLKSFTPVVAMVNMVCGRGFSQRPNDNDDNDRDLKEKMLPILAKELYANTRQANLDLITMGVGNLSTIDHIPLLTSLTLLCENFSEAELACIHKSASTLQRLNIKIHDANKLIYNADGEAVIYPNLQYLEIKGPYHIIPSANDKAIKTVPFPVLRALQLHMTYPFHDDILFRGNYDTLEYLRLHYGNETFVRLNQARVFENKHKVLRHIRLGVTCTTRGDPSDNEASTNKFLNNLVCTATNLAIFESVMTKVVIKAAQNGQGFQNIKVFEASIFGLTVYSMLHILKALPALEKLSSSIDGSGPELEDMSAEELLDYITLTYDNVGKNLQVWRLSSPCPNYTSSTINHILLLALVCPNLWRIQLEPGFIEDYHSKLANALESGPYSKYAPQLNRVLDIVRE